MYVWEQIAARFAQNNPAFRFFPLSDKGILRKQDFKDGLYKLKVNISNQDFEQVWRVMDTARNGQINFNQFCLLQQKANQLSFRQAERITREK